MDRAELKDTVFMDIAITVAELSTCRFTRVGAIIVDPTRMNILSIGYNGTLPGKEHCRDKTFHDREEHRIWSDENEIHAEYNALIGAAKNGHSTEGTYLYTTVAPCKNCAKHIVAAGVKRVLFNTLYWRDETLYTHGIEYKHVEGFSRG